MRKLFAACVAQPVEYFLGKEEVASSNLATGLKTADFSSCLKHLLNLLGNLYRREGRKARPNPVDLRSTPAEVHAFESHPSHPLFGSEAI